MTCGEPARTTRRIRIRGIQVAGLLVVIAAIAAALGHQRPAVMSPTGSSSSTAASRSAHRGALGEADGAVPAGTTVFDDGVPGVANLDRALLHALRRAAAEAEGDGVEILVDSGWRSPAYQEHLRRQAIAKYGSEAAAARWVATPGTSAHVSGDAVDIGPAAATAWLSAHGAAYGLCQVYANEPWHYELRPGAVADGCPAMYPDAAHDPRLRR